MNVGQEVSYDVLSGLLEDASDFANWVILLDSATVALGIINRLDPGFAHPSALVDTSWDDAARGEVTDLTDTFTRCTAFVQLYLTDEEEPEDLEDRPEMLARAGFVVVDTCRPTPLTRRVLKASTGVLDTFQYLDEIVQYDQAVRLLGEVPVATDARNRPVEAWALERLVTGFRILASAPAHQAVPRVRALSRRGIDLFDLFITWLDTQPEWAGDR